MEVETQAWQEDLKCYEILLFFEPVECLIATYGGSQIKTMKSYQLKCFDGRTYFDSIICSSLHDGKIKLTFESRDLHFVAEDHFPFFALVNIRLFLESQNVRILCNGSRVDVYPSGFFMGSFIAYKLVMGKVAEREDLLNILDATGEYEKIGTVEEQEVYWQSWLGSSKGRGIEDNTK